MPHIDALTVLLAAAFLLDLCFGDPAWLPHPVRLIGSFIHITELVLVKIIGRNIFSGCLLTLIVVGGTFFGSWFLIALALKIHFAAGFLISLYLLYTCFSAGDLDSHSRRIYKDLNNENLPQARRDLSLIVGRDTDSLNENEITRATVESVAESTVDGVLSPLFFAALGGAPAALAFKAVSTLDSMVGYKNKLYRRFGTASARFDDLLNYLPARFARILFPIASLICGFHFKQCLAIVLRDGRKSPSPNSGISEAAVSGALGVQLGGVNFYKGIEQSRPLLGDPLRPLEREDLKRAVRLMYVVSFLMLSVVIAGRLFIL